MVAEFRRDSPPLVTETEISFLSVSNSKLPPPKTKSASPPTGRFFSKRDSHEATNMRRISIAPPGVLHCTSTISPNFSICHAANAHVNSIRICSLLGVRMITWRLVCEAIAPRVSVEEVAGLNKSGVASNATNAMASAMRLMLNLLRPCPRLAPQVRRKFPWQIRAPPPRHVDPTGHRDFQTPASRCDWR